MKTIPKAFVNKAEPTHQERTLHLTHDERIVDVVAGERKDGDREHHTPVDQPQRILPHIDRDRRAHPHARMLAAGVRSSQIDGFGSSGVQCSALGA